MTKKLEWSAAASITNGVQGLTVRGSEVLVLSGLNIPTEERGAYTSSLRTKLDSTNSIRGGIEKLGSGPIYMMSVLMATREEEGNPVNYTVASLGEDVRATRTYQDADGSVVSSNIRTFDSLLEAMDACELWDGNQDPVA